MLKATLDSLKRRIETERAAHASLNYSNEDSGRSAACDRNSTIQNDLCDINPDSSKKLDNLGESNFHNYLGEPNTKEPRLRQPVTESEHDLLELLDSSDVYDHLESSSPAKNFSAPSIKWDSSPSSASATPGDLLALKNIHDSSSTLKPRISISDTLLQKTLTVTENFSEDQSIQNIDNENDEELVEFLPYPMMPESFTMAQLDRNAKSIVCKNPTVFSGRILLSEFISGEKRSTSLPESKVLLVMIRQSSMANLAGDVGVDVVDESGVIAGATIDGQVLSQHSVRLHFGMFLVLQRIHLFRGSHLIITPSNVIKILCNVHFV